MSSKKLKGGRRALRAPAPTTHQVQGVPVATLSIWDPIYLGLDEYGQPVYMSLPGYNILAGGLPGGGKSGLLNNMVGHAALSPDCRLYLFDGKRVELGLWEPVADVFVGPDPDEAIHHLRHLQKILNDRYDELGLSRRRKITPADGQAVYVVVIDELSWYSATVGTDAQQREFTQLTRGLVAMGRAGGMPVVAATQRPTAEVVSPSLRDIFAFRAAFTCATHSSSDVILGQGWAKEGYSAKDIPIEDPGVCLLLTENGTPRRLRTSYLSDENIYDLVDMAAWIRTSHAGTGGVAA